MVAMAGFCCCRRAPALWAFESMAGRLPPTSQRAFSGSASAGLKRLSSLRVGNFSNSHLSRRGLAEEQRVVSRCALLSAFGTVASRRAFYMEGRGKGGSSSSQGGRTNGTAARASEQNGRQQQVQERGELPRPPLIYWESDLVNALQLIGHVGRDIVVKYLDNGKVVANTSLSVKNVINKNEGPSWFELEIWDDIAEIAAYHVKKGDQVFVTGWIVLDKRVKDGVADTNVKVVVRDFCFVESENDPRQPYRPQQAASRAPYRPEQARNRAPSQRSWTPPQSAKSV